MRGLAGTATRDFDLGSLGDTAEPTVHEQQTMERGRTGPSDKPEVGGTAR
jgi:hypothetical protein